MIQFIKFSEAERVYTVYVRYDAAGGKGNRAAIERFPTLGEALAWLWHVDRPWAEAFSIEAVTVR